MLLLIDNHDSFTYNLYDYFQQLKVEVIIAGNQPQQLAELIALKPAHLVISPGPGRPEDTGISQTLIQHFAGQIPILGVCLGHQAIAQLFGAQVIKGTQPVHGKVSAIEHDGQTLFTDLPQPLSVVRYHSLVVERQSLPACLQVSAQTTDGTIMSLRHRDYPIEGVQFHPEAILTQNGLQLLANFLQLKV